jgi:hypothetical protein
VSLRAFDSRLERLELKYLVDEATAARVRRQIAPWCGPDPHAASAGGAGSYPITSLYLDTPALAFHRAKERGDPERFKLRVRRYRGLAAHCLELKRRSSDVVEKTRALVDCEGLREAAHGLGKPRDDTPEARRFVERYAGLMLATGAEPALLVRYDREAWTSEVDSYARVTFDGHLEFQRCCEWTLEGRPDAWCELEDSLVEGAPRPLVVLEIKCGTRVPAWLVDVIRGNELRRDSVSKYSIGIYLTRRLQGGTRGQERARGVFR